MLFKGIIKIIKARSKYRGDVNSPEIKFKKYFFKWFGMLFTVNNTLMALGCFYFTLGTMPWFGLFLAAIIFFMNLRESLRSFYYLLLESVTTARERGEGWNSIKTYEGITAEQVQKVSNNPYFNELFTEILVSQTPHCRDNLLSQTNIFWQTGPN